MTMVEGEELQRLWQLVSELSSQLSANQTLCKSLQDQADELKGQALHTGTGFALRRFNTDISKEKFESDLERLNAYLVQENQTLAHENKQSNVLLREYEGMLETIMGKFRSFSHATQQHTLALTEHYESLLANSAHETERAELRQNTALSEHLAHLGGLVRSALRELDGEALDDDASDDVEMDDDISNGGSDKLPEITAQHMNRRKAGRTDPFEAEGYHVGSPSGGPSRVHLAIPDRVLATSSSGSSSASSVVGSSVSKAKKKRQGYGSSRTRDPRWYGTGGYTGIAGDPDADVAERALEAQIEEERLRHENEVLRELLRVSAEYTPELAEHFGMEPPKPPPPGGWGALSAKLSLGKPRGAKISAEEEETSHDSQSTEKSVQPSGSHIIASKAEEQTADASEDNAPAYSLEPAGADVEDKLPLTESVAVPSSAANNGVVLDLVTGGAGGPPQLDDKANRSVHQISTLHSNKTGTVVTAGLDHEPSNRADLMVSPGAVESSSSAPPTPASADAAAVPLDTEAMIKLQEDETFGQTEVPQQSQSDMSSPEGHPKPDDSADDGGKEARAQLLDQAEDHLQRATETVETMDEDTKSATKADTKVDEER